MGEQIIVKTYTGKEAEATIGFRADAALMAARGYSPVFQSWAPGQWQWDGRRYIWVTGAWRIPPSPQHSWQPARWTISTRGAIFVPGGWRVRIGR